MPKQPRPSLPGRKAGSVKRKKTANHDSTAHTNALITDLTVQPGYFKPSKTVSAKQHDSDDDTTDDLPTRINNTTTAPAATAGTDRTPVPQYVDPETTAKILRQVNKQQNEVDNDEDDDADDQPIDTDAVNTTSQSRRQRRNSTVSIALSNVDSDSDEGVSEFGDNDEYDGDDIEHELDELDESDLNTFLPDNTAVKHTLADAIFASIDSATAAVGNKDEYIVSRVDPQIRAVYAKVGTFLSHYTSGKIPKAFKIIPSLRNWEEVLYCTEPDGWTPQATYVATKLFTSNLNPKMAQRFYSLILLPKLTDNIGKYKKLNYHLYQAVRKTLYKPASFFKGILLPLAETCSARDAVIVSSILAKNSIPILHSAVALLKLCDMQYNTATELFIKTLINKKYSLPYRVIDRLVEHFISFGQTGADGQSVESMPVVWHQSLLVFVQRYKNELSSTQMKQLKQLIKQQQHHAITPEIKRELYAPRPMDATKMEKMQHDDVEPVRRPVMTEY